MSKRYFSPSETSAPESQIGATLETLAATIGSRKSAGEESYTWRLLQASEDKLAKKVIEEAGEVALAMKDCEASQGDAHEDAINHLRYETADEIYHLLVVCARYGIEIDELAAELNTRMQESERPAGAVVLNPESVNRG